MTAPVRKAVFPVGGLGTRFLPATKAMPKEMLPVVDKPLIQYALEEAQAAGIEQFIFVTSRSKSALEDHFDHAYELEATLRERGKNAEILELNAWLPKPGQVAYTRQQRPLGLGHAVWCARDLVGDEPFAVLLCDDLILGATPCLQQMVAARGRIGGNLIAVMDVPRAHTKRYGILDAVAEEGQLVRAKGVVEKPAPEAAPSTLAVIGRYILEPEVFEHLGRIGRGAGNEIQLTDALARMIGGQRPFHGFRFEGRRFDCGDKAGFLEATIAYAMARPALAPDMQRIMREYRDADAEAAGAAPVPQRRQRSCAREHPMRSDASHARGHRFNPTILREYDVRGTVGSTLFEADAEALGRAFAVCIAEAGGKRAAVGRDGRLSSPALERALIKGLTESGIDVLRIGLGPTPMLYYAAMTQEVDAGVMVTGSHNPGDQNGFKLVLQKRSFYGADIQRLGEIAARAGYRAGTGKLSTVELLDQYVARLAKDYDGKHPLSVVWDAGNGATGQVLVRLAKTRPGKHVLLNEAIDGRFPAHHPDPTEAKNLVQLQAAVKEQRADLGIAFDGDGDRIGVVDAQGRILWGDQLMTVLAADVIREKPGATIIADVKASQVLFDEIARVGGTPLMWRTGHSIIKSKMAEIAAPLAGEMSGHIFYADRYYGYDDALYAGVRLIGILGRSEASLATLRDRLPQVVNTPELRFPCEESRKFAVVSEVRDRLKAARAEMSDIDGVRVNTADGWWLLRASNTQAVLVARAEARDEAALTRLKHALAGELRASGVEPPEF